MKKILKKLNGNQLFDYFLNSDDSEMASAVALLPYAEPDNKKAFALLERVVRDDMTLVAIYPGNGEKPSPGMQLVGSIPDGALYIK